MDIVSLVLLSILPGLVIAAALSDLTTMKIPNWLSGSLIVGFFPAALAVGLPLGINLLQGVDGYMGELQTKVSAVCQIWAGGCFTESIINNNSIRKIRSLVDLDQLLTTIKKI